MSASQTSRETASQREDAKSQSHVAEREDARRAAEEDPPHPNPHTVQPQASGEALGPSGVHPRVARKIRQLIDDHGVPHVEQALKEARGQGSSY